MAHLLLAPLILAVLLTVIGAAFFAQTARPGLRPVGAGLIAVAAVLAAAVLLA